MKYSSGDETKLYYNRAGNKDPSLIFLHGLNANNTIWKKIIDEIDYQTFSLDLRGHGKSDKPYTQEKYDVERFIQDIEELKKKENVQKYVLIGHSFGGMITMQHEIKRGEAIGLVLLSTSPNITPTFVENKFDKNIIERIKEKVEKIERVVETNDTLNMEAYGDTYNVWMQELLSMTPHAALSCIETILNIDMTNQLENIEPPVNVIHGNKDEIIPFEEGKKLYKNIPRATLQPIKEGYHQPMLDHPKKISKAIKTFVERVSNQ